MATQRGDASNVTPALGQQSLVNTADVAKNHQFRHAPLHSTVCAPLTATEDSSTSSSPYISLVSVTHHPRQTNLAWTTHGGVQPSNNSHCPNAPNDTNNSATACTARPQHTKRWTPVAGCLLKLSIDYRRGNRFIRSPTHAVQATSNSDVVTSRESLLPTHARTASVFFPSATSCSMARSSRRVYIYTLGCPHQSPTARRRAKLCATARSRAQRNWLQQLRRLQQRRRRWAMSGSLDAAKRRWDSEADAESKQQGTLLRSIDRLIHESTFGAATIAVSCIILRAPRTTDNYLELSLAATAVEQTYCELKYTDRQFPGADALFPTRTWRANAFCEKKMRKLGVCWTHTVSLLDFQRVRMNSCRPRFMQADACTKQLCNETFCINCLSV